MCASIRFHIFTEHCLLTLSCSVHLERLGSLSEDAVRFYVAEIASALTFLHEKRIIHRCVDGSLHRSTCSSIVCRVRWPLLKHPLFHRDLKPDNILLDEKGHAHITDMNIAVHYSERRMLTGVAGSMAYMGERLVLSAFAISLRGPPAPEVLTKKGYTYTIDWWSLGVCAYELIFGRRPFRGKTNSDLTHAITRETLKFPEDASTKCSREGMYVLMGVSGVL